MRKAPPNPTTNLTNFDELTPRRIYTICDLCGQTTHARHHQRRLHYIHRKQFAMSCVSKASTCLYVITTLLNSRTLFVRAYREISSEFGKRTISGYVSTDVALESALLALGRCADLVRPAGRLTSRSVSQEEWTDAIQQLEHFLDLMETACDPDRPLPADQWGLLSLPRSFSTNSLPVDAVDPTTGMERDAMLDLADLFGADIGMDDSLE